MQREYEENEWGKVSKRIVTVVFVLPVYCFVIEEEGYINIIMWFVEGGLNDLENYFSKLIKPTLNKSHDYVNLQVQPVYLFSSSTMTTQYTGNTKTTITTTKMAITMITTS